MCAALFFVLGTIGAWALRTDGRDAREAASSPPRLPPPKLLPVTGIAERVDTEKMMGRAETVFVGRVAEVGGSEVVTPAGGEGEPSLLTRHRVRFAVTRVLRGTNAEWIDVSLLDIPGASYEFEDGKEYLVFARRTELGTSRIAALVPDGYSQGVYAIVGGDAAVNPVNGKVDVSRIADRLR